MLTRFSRLFFLALLPTSLLALTACDGVTYVAHVAKGELNIQLHAQPIEDVLASGSVSEQDAEKLRLVLRARDFAVQTVGLANDASYTTFFNTDGGPLAFNLSAARRDALEPHTWRFPVVGVIPYLGFFDKEYLEQVQQDLENDGYDTYTYEVPAYSTGGFFTDPLPSPMLRYSDYNLASTVIHELVHATIYRAGYTDFNESLASFIGDTAAAEFLNTQPPEAAPFDPVAYQLNQEDRWQTNEFLATLYDDLAAHYAKPLTVEERVAGRDAVYQAARARFVSDVSPQLHSPRRYQYLAELPTNNAWLLLHRRYHYDPPDPDDVPDTQPTDQKRTVFEQVYDAAGHDWPTALNVFRAAAQAEAAPFDYLRTWLDQR